MSSRYKPIPGRLGEQSTAEEDMKEIKTLIGKIEQGINNRQNGKIRYNVETAVVLLRRLYAHVEQEEPT